MSDSDSSASDSDISQGWTVVGQDGAVDSSDPDSDIVILKDEEEITDQSARKPEHEELGNQRSDELDLQSMEPECQAAILNVEPEIERNMEQGQDAEILSMEPELASVTTGMEPDDGAKSRNIEPDSTEPERKVPAILEPDSKLENVMKEGEDKCDTGIKEEEKIGDNGLLKKDAGSISTGLAKDGSIAEVAEASEHSVEWISSLEVKEAQMEPESVAETSNSMEPVLLSTSRHSPFHDFLASSAAEKQTPPTEESPVPLNSLHLDDKGNEADASNDDTDNDDSDDDDDDDDESVVRKFHEATFNLCQRPGDRIENQQNNEEEDEVVPPDVDDRCESDISGVADESDSDLSSVAGIDDLQLNVGEVVRTYRHQPNPTMNSRLSIVAATTVLLVLGIGIGHYIGTTRGSSFHQQQVLRLKTLQDEYFVCLRDTEKLESKLAKNPVEKIAAVTAVWRKKYEELVLERAELEYRLIQLQESIQMKEERDHEQRPKSIEQRHEPHNGLKEHQPQPRVDTLKEEREQEQKSIEQRQEPKNSLEEHQPEPRVDKLKKDELRCGTETDSTSADEPPDHSAENSSTSEGVRCCHEVTILTADLNKRNVELDELRNDANQLVVENSDLKAAILNQRYSEHPGNSGIGTTEGDRGFNKQPGDYDNKSLEDVSLAERMHASEDLKFPKPIAHQEEQNMVQSQNHSESGATVGAYSQQKVEDVSTQPIIISVIRFFVSSSGKTPDQGSVDSESLGTVVNCFTTLENISLDHSFYELLVQQTWSELEESVRKVDLETAANQWESIRRSCNEFIDFETAQNYSFVNNEDASIPAQNETTQVNKLREMVKKLDVAVQGTVKSMKKLSKQPESPRARMKAKNAVEKWSRRMLSDWSKVDERMFRIHAKDVFSDSKKTKNEPSEDFGKAASNGETLDQRSVGGEKSKQTAFEGNRDHKQTESSSSSHQKYDEFWKWNHFDPDDFLQEGFFEDNQREWHKHQKRLRKISGRIQRLTEEILLSMDDDDVEDIYEDVEDFVEDMEDREIPDQLRTWLMCQARWWRCRVQRKHRNEDLVMGCGQQLMHWQLRVLCDKGNKCGSRVRKRSKICEAVMSSQGGGGMETDRGNERKREMKRGFGSGKVSSSRSGRSAAKSFQQSAPKKKAQNVNSKVKHDLRKVAHGKRVVSSVDYKTEKISTDDTFTSRNLTFADHGAYDNDLECPFFSWSQTCSRTADAGEGHYNADLLRGPFSHQPDKRGKSQTSFDGSNVHGGNNVETGRMRHRCWDE